MPTEGNEENEGLELEIQLEFSFPAKTTFHPLERRWRKPWFGLSHAFVCFVSFCSRRIVKFSVSVSVQLQIAMNEFS
jgi:hypothetical protein